MGILLLIFTVVLVFILKYSIKRYIFLQKLSHIKQPKGVLFFGNALDFVKSTDLTKSILKYYKEQGPLFKVFLGPFYTHVYILEPDMLQQVFNSKKLIDKADEYRFLSNWLGNGLATASGNVWSVNRKLMTPAFHFKILETFSSHLKKPYEVLEKKITQANGESIQVDALLNLYTLDIVCETSMGLEVNAQVGKESPIVRSIQELSRIVSKRSFSPFNRIDFIYKFTKDFKAEAENCKLIHDITDSIISKRKKESHAITGAEEELKKTSRAFLDIFLKYQEEFGMSDEHLRSEVNTIMFAGQDTTSNGITFALYCLAKHPKEQEKLFAEVIAMLPSSSSGKFTVGDLNKCKYLDMVIKEVLRLFPPVPLIAREVTEDVEICNVLIPKGVSLLISPYAVHRNEKYFEDPEKFDPERFNDKNVSKLHPYCYIPFSAGLRNCIGQKFAMQNLKYAIANLVRTFEIKLVDSRELITYVEITLKPKDGCFLKFKKRS